VGEVVFVDWSVLLNVLDVPGMNSDSGRLIAEFKALAQAGVTLVYRPPLSSRWGTTSPSCL